MKNEFQLTHNARCERCAFAIQVRANPTDLHTSLECRGAPPAVAVVPGPNGSGQVMFLPRLMPADYWCAQFKPGATTAVLIS